MRYCFESNFGAEFQQETMILPYFLLILINAVQFKSGAHVRLTGWAQRRYYLQIFLSESKY